MAEYILKLYITGHTPHSDRATADLRHLCNDKLKGQYQLEIINILEHPEHAEHEKILATPMLIKESPAPLCRIVGNFSDKDKVLLHLGVTSSVT